jgi:hypothetical protein
MLNKNLAKAILKGNLEIRFCEISEPHLSSSRLDSIFAQNPVFDVVSQGNNSLVRVTAP